MQSLSEAPQRLRERLHEAGLAPERAAGPFMAALREAFEVDGVLAGQDDSNPALAARLRQQLQSQAWHQSLRQTGQPLRTEALLPWSRWP